jgi:arylformamidase
MVSTASARSDRRRGAVAPVPGSPRTTVRPRPIGPFLTLVLAVLAVACTGPVTSTPSTPGTAGRSPDSGAPTVPLLGCDATGTFAYASHAGVDPNLTSLDVFTPPADEAGCSGRPMVVWVHGGGWTSGDKSEYMTDKVTLFNGAGFVFASINYRLTDKDLPSPAPQHPVHDQDAADALAWLIDHAAELGGDPDRIAVLGHSAGGGIVSAVATDESYLGRSGVPLDALDCVGSMDGEGYDVVAGATTSPVEIQTGYRNVFGSDPAVWERASPIRHVAPDAGIARFFIAARGTDWRIGQHLAFIEALRMAGIPATVLDATALEHADLATDVGAPDDTVVTPALMDFLAGCFAAP